MRNFEKQNCLNFQRIREIRLKLYLLQFAGEIRICFLERLHNTQHNNSQHNDTQHNDTQHNDIQHNDIQHNSA